MNILIADDSKMARRIVIKTLNDLIIDKEFNIYEACNGEEALQTYTNNSSIDVVFLDLTMPVMDGFEALEKIKKYDKNAKIIVVSADIQKVSMDKVRQLGAIDFIKKPINCDKVNLILNKIFKQVVN